MADFFDELRFWSEIKLRILEKYLDAYLRKRGSYNSLIYYVDGFAGPGHYDGRDSTSTVEGSPVRIARLAQKIQREDRSYRLVCLNVERNRNRCRSLQQAVEQFDPDLVHVLCGTFVANLPRLLSIMKPAPAVCFLDPFGVVNVSPRELSPLLRRYDTEVFLNLNSRVLHRLAGSATSDAREAPGKVRRLSVTLGEDPKTTNPEWLQKWHTLSSQEWEAWAVGRYIGELQRTGPQLRYGLAYPIRKWAGGRAKYYLVFASRSKDAFPIMNDFLCTEEDDLNLKAELARTAPGQMALFRPVFETEREQQFASLSDEIHAYGLLHQGCSRKQLIEQFTFDRLGQFKQKHYRQVLDHLAARNRIEFGPGRKDEAPLTFK